MQPEQHLVHNISLTLASFEQFAVACKLSVICSSGYVRHNSAGKSDKSCFSTAEAFNISDYLRFFDKPWGRLTIVTLGTQKFISAIWFSFFPHSYTYFNNHFFPFSAATCQMIWSVSHLDINHSTFNSSVARFFVAHSCSCCHNCALPFFAATCQAVCSESSLSNKNYYLYLL
jgi:hypothetical protein